MIPIIHKEIYPTQTPYNSPKIGKFPVEKSPLYGDESESDEEQPVTKPVNAPQKKIEVTHVWPDIYFGD